MPCNDCQSCDSHHRITNSRNRSLSIFKERKLLEEATCTFWQQQLASDADDDKCDEDGDAHSSSDDDKADENDEEDDWARIVKQISKALSSGSSDLRLMASTEMSTLIDEANKPYSGETSTQVDWVGFLTMVQKIPRELWMDMKIVIHDDCLYLAERNGILLWWTENASMHDMTALPMLRLHHLPTSQKQIHSKSGCYRSCAASLMDSDLRERLGNDKLETLCVLSFNTSTLKTFEGDSNTLNNQIESLESPSSASLAAEIMVYSYGLDLDHDAIDEQKVLSNSTMRDKLQSSAA